jgi:uncharacterized protein YndB with AHSA1/START domain
MKDILEQLSAVSRETGSRRVEGAETKTVTMRRRYDAPIDDVWDAITDPARISRWFLPVSGDLRLGGTYQLEGNAGGEIVRCEPPRHLAVTWFFGPRSDGDVSVVEVRLTDEAGATTLVLDHAATVPPDRWDEFGPGAVGVGWDLALVGLWMHLDGQETPNHEELESSPELRRAMTESSEAWGAAFAASGAPDDQVKRAVTNTTAFYVPPIGDGS